MVLLFLSYTPWVFSFYFNQLNLTYTLVTLNTPESKMLILVPPQHGPILGCIDTKVI